MVIVDAASVIVVKLDNVPRAGVEVGNSAELIQEETKTTRIPEGRGEGWVNEASRKRRGPCEGGEDLKKYMDQSMSRTSQITLQNTRKHGDNKLPDGSRPEQTHCFFLSLPPALPTRVD